MTRESDAGLLAIRPVSWIACNPDRASMNP